MKQKIFAIVVIIVLIPILCAHASPSTATIIFNPTSYVPCVPSDIGKYVYCGDTGAGLGTLTSFNNSAYTWTIAVISLDNLEHGEVVGYPIVVAKGTGSGFASVIVDPPVVPEFPTVALFPLFTVMAGLAVIVRKCRKK